MWEAVNEIHSSVDRVDYPSWCIAQHSFFAVARVFFSDKLVVGKLLLDAVNQQSFDLLIRLGYQVDIARFYFN